MHGEYGVGVGSVPSCMVGMGLIYGQYPYVWSVWGWCRVSTPMYGQYGVSVGSVPLCMVGMGLV